MPDDSAAEILARLRQRADVLLRPTEHLSKIPAAADVQAVIEGRE